MEYVDTKDRGRLDERKRKTEKSRKRKENRGRSLAQSRMEDGQKRLRNVSQFLRACSFMKFVYAHRQSPLYVTSAYENFTSERMKLSWRASLRVRRKVTDIYTISHFFSVCVCVCVLSLYSMTFKISTNLK